MGEKIKIEGLPQSYSEAVRLGEKHYMSPKPCKRGHIAPRVTMTSNCLKCKSSQAWEHQKKNRQVYYDRAAKWRAANPEKAAEIQKRSYAKGGLERLREWRAANPERDRAYIHKRRARMRAGGTFTPEEAVAMLGAQGWLCTYCATDLRIAGYHLDHMMPLSRGGLNVIANLQGLCGPCNMRKNKRTHDEFLALQCA